VKESISNRKKKIRQLLNRSIAAIALVVVLVLLLTNLPGPAGETAVPVNFQAVESSDIVPGLQNSADRLPPGKQTVHELAVNPDTVVNNHLQSAAPVTEEPVPEKGGLLSISGMVIDEAGIGVPGIEVLATLKNLFQLDEDPEASRNERERKALADSDGFYEIQGLDDGEYRIRTQADDFYEAAQAVVRAGVETADLVLRERRPEVDIFGTVRSDEGEPLDNVEVFAIGQSGEAAYTDAQGFYELALKVSNSKPAYTLRFVREGYREKRSVVEPQEMARPEQIRVDTELEPVRELVDVSGTVHNKKGKPVPGESVQLYSEAARQRYTATSDSYGEVWFEEVETSSDYSLAVHPTDSYRDFSIQGVEITLAGADLEIVLEPLALGSLTGQMVDPEGKPVPEFSLWLRNPDAINQAALLVTGDQQGHFSVDEVEAGTLVFETRSSPQYSISGVHLTAGEEKVVTLVLDWGHNQVAGLVVDVMGRPIAVSELYVTSLRRDNGLRAHAVRRAITDEAGFFLFTQVGPGYHTIRVDVPGFIATIIDHDVGMDTPEVIIRLERASSHGM
jgi:protocatechuate 3,4-dioxygenase beta subunit